MSQVTRRAFLKIAGTGVVGAFLASCVTAPAAGPSSAPVAAAPKKIIFSSYTWSGYEASMNQVIDIWKGQNPGIDVEGQYIATDYWTKLQTQVAAGTSPDVGISDYGLVISYVKNGILAPLSDLIARDNYPLDKLIPAGVAQYRWREGDFDTGGKDGTMYGLPSDAQGYIFVYNKKMFDQAGVAYPTDDWTWDDLVTAAKKIAKPDANKWGVYAPGLGTLVRGNFVYAAGGAFTTPDYKKSALDSPETLSAYKWAWDLMYTHKVAPRQQPSVPINPFLSGQTAMYFDGVWWIADFSKITDFEWDMALFPKNPKTGKRTTSLESDGWWVFKGTKNIDAAWNLTKFLASEQGQKKFSELDYVIPPSFPEAAKGWYAKKPPANRHKALDNVIQDSQKVSLTYFESQSIRGAYQPILEKAFFNGDKIEDVIQEAAKVMNQELDRAWSSFA